MNRCAWCGREMWGNTYPLAFLTSRGTCSHACREALGEALLALARAHAAVPA